MNKNKDATQQATATGRVSELRSLAHPFWFDKAADELFDALLREVDKHYGSFRVADHVREAAHDHLRDVYNVVEAAHRGQRRGEGTPYVRHPLRVAYAVAHRYRPERVELGSAVALKLESYLNLISAALAHDVIEDSEKYREELTSVLSPAALEGVVALTKVEGEPMSDYYTRVRSNRIALAVKPEDRIDNLRFIDRCVWDGHERPDAGRNGRYLAYSGVDVMGLARATDLTYRIGEVEDELARVIRVQASRLANPAYYDCE